jgi:hypothetical protein
LPCNRCGGTERKPWGACVKCRADARHKFFGTAKGKHAKADDALLRKYGINVEQRDLMLLGQGGVCAVCKHDKPAHEVWHVDHCHDTGVVRGVLCRACNTGLGCFRDNAESLRSAVEYLTGQTQPVRVWFARESAWLFAQGAK